MPTNNASPEHTYSINPDLSKIGGKAYTLELLKDKMVVPKFVVIESGCFQHFLQSNYLERKINGIIERCDIRDPLSADQAQRKICSIIQQQPIPQSVIDTVENLAELKGPFMVRSSALGEDSEEASFAGQLDSFKTDEHPDNICEAVKKCWASYWSARSLFYQQSREIRLMGMAVIIQKYIEPALAGVVFTQAPSMDYNEMRVEYCYGHGENLVSGKVTPGVIRVNRASMSIRLESEPNTPENKTTSNFTITPKSPFLQKLIHHCLEIEQTLERPADIEWAVDQNQNLHILQARPITTSFAKKKHIWSNVNVNENYPGLISPLLFSIAHQSYYHYFKNLALRIGIPEAAINKSESSLQNIVGCHGSRIYYNMSSIHQVIQLLPHHQVFSSYFNDFVGVNCSGSADSTAKEEMSTKHEYSLGRNLLIAGKTLFTFLQAPITTKKFEKDVDSHLANFHRNERSAKEQRFEELKKRFEEFLEIRFSKWNNAAIADFSAMSSYGLLGSLLRKFYEDNDAQSKQNLLLQGITNLVSSVPTQKIWELSEEIKKDKSLLDTFRNEATDIILYYIENDNRSLKFRNLFHSYLSKWGYRCSGELMLTEPNYLEQPDKFVELIKSYIESDSISPDQIINKRRAEKKKLLITIKNDLVELKPITGLFIYFCLRLMVFWTEEAISYRERVRLKQAILYGHLRTTLLHLGRLLRQIEVLKHETDIFYLEYSELSKLLSDQTGRDNGLLETLEERKSVQKEDEQITLPDSFVLPEGATLRNNEIESLAPINSSSHNLRGTSACGGKVIGKAKVLGSILEAKKIEPGDILITKQTDPGWAPVFPLISGLIIERGGMLSHGAIVAREFGIPAVVGIQNITQLITDGKEVLVNGDDGSIHF